ncbi:LysR family transcriptional regulator [Bacillus pumilus]|uniref:Transcriptional regulator n=1 Tax=Bacillus pumilus (strain SAFR-032) TaxID=315750 RepID=A8FCE4_BACP2|nr:LysR family transcriptional regulator [Bacillus pumilus]ABV61911.1 transcriptional regulator [Bacillus pumilus SAFR-032]MBC3642615.1 LysR family transcriptional regulator [Bacillus pumilus]MBC3646702.1 LysR family transcriptional regulator [Bacillus pumilus]MBC3650420.1 LysR family transcriptional regulator [Bacillus pumilus]MBC3653446.1 LysR family transcriptional regulator [Bacillus pumilus]
MDITSLEIFKAVAIEQSITKAAEKLNYVQSNVSARIQRLEQELGVPLFYRYHKKISLTPAGRELLPYANKLLYDFEEAIEAVKLSSTPRGTLHIGSIESTASTRLPSIFAAYHKTFSQVELSMYMAPTVDQVDAILNYKVDGALVDGPILHPDIIEYPVLEESLVLITSYSQEEFHVESILHEPLLSSFAHCIYLGRWQRWLESKGFAPMKVMEYGTLEGVLKCVENGLGVTVLPKSMVESRMQGRFTCHPLPEPHRIVPTVFIRRRDSYMTSALSHFMEFIGITHM